MKNIHAWLLLSLLFSPAVARDISLIRVKVADTQDASLVAPSKNFLDSASEVSSTSTSAVKNSQAAEEARVFFQRALQQASFPPDCTYRCPKKSKRLHKCPQSFADCVCKPGWEPDPDGDPYCTRIPRQLRGA